MWPFTTKIHSTAEPKTTAASGFLHMEIVRERLEREFDLDLIVTAPTVAYRVRETNSSEWLEVSGRNLAYSDFARKANAKRGKGKIIE